MKKGNSIFTQVFSLGCILLSICFYSCGDDSGCTDPNACNYDPQALTDNGNCQSGSTWFEDQDQDGFGNPLSSTTSCTQPEGYVSNDSDEFDLIINNDQRVVIAYIGATWCPPCGELGGPLLEYADENVDPSESVILSFQQSDLISPQSSIASEYASEIGDVTEIFAVPHIYIGGATYFVERGLYTNSTANINKLNSDVAAITALDARVGLNGTAKLQDNKINVGVGLEFYTSSNEEYYLSTYLLEDNVVTDQKVGAVNDPALETNVNHNHIVRANFDGSSSYIGKNIGNVFSSGQVISDNLSISIPSLPGAVHEVNNEHIKVAIVVWRGTDFKMENGIIIEVK